MNRCLLVCLLTASFLSCDKQGAQRPDLAVDVVSPGPEDVADEPDLSEDEDVADIPDGPPTCPQITPTAPPAALGLDPFYQKHVDVGGVPLIGSEKVSDDAFRMAYYVLANMLADSPCVRQAIIGARVRIGIMARSEVTTDMPEYSDLNDVFPETNWDTRGRGYGATLVRPLTSNSEENLLAERSDPWFGENILIHEFGHTYFEHGVRGLVGGEARQQSLLDAFAAAQAQGLWDNTYANTNDREYWAEGVQSWFDNNLEAIPANGIHNHINTREELIEHDAQLSALLKDLFTERRWAPYCDLTGQGPAWQDPTPADPSAAECDLIHEALVDLGCDTEAQRRSQSSDVETQVTIINRDPIETLDLHWLGFDGQRSAYGQIGPRTTRTLSTFVTHPWVLTDAQGQCVGIYEPEEGHGRVFLD